MARGYARDELIDVATVFIDAEIARSAVIANLVEILQQPRDELRRSSAWPPNRVADTDDAQRPVPTEKWLVDHISILAQPAPA
jgi:hypothetical protein